MSPAFIIIVWLLYTGINIAIAEWNDTVRRSRIKAGNPRQIEHFWYWLGYCLLCLPVYLISESWVELLSILLLHISVFTVSYNRFSDLPAFNLSKTSKAITDRTLVKIGLKSYAPVAIPAFIISLALFTLQLFHK